MHRLSGFAGAWSQRLLLPVRAARRVRGTVLVVDLGRQRSRLMVERRLVVFQEFCKKKSHGIPL